MTLKIIVDSGGLQDRKASAIIVTMGIMVKHIKNDLICICKNNYARLLRGKSRTEFMLANGE